MTDFSLSLLKASQWRLQHLLNGIDGAIENLQSDKDLKKLAEINGQICNASSIRRCKHNIQTFYEEYTISVSSSLHAISLEQAAFILQLCTTMRPKNLIDFGSGFSSFVTRLYQSATESVSVTSVDDNPDWLEKTKNYLLAKQLSDSNLITGEVFFKNCSMKEYDFLYYDLGNMLIREKYFERVLNLFLACKGSLLMVDDMHHYHFRKFVLGMLKQKPIQYFNLKRITRDSFGRYACLLLN